MFGSRQRHSLGLELLWVTALYLERVDARLTLWRLGRSMLVIQQK